MKKGCCKECPWVVKNRHNESITSHSKRLDKPHNCHMITSDIWNSKEETICKGYKKYKDENRS